MHDAVSGLAKQAVRREEKRRLPRAAGGPASYMEAGLDSLGMGAGAVPVPEQTGN
jgi:hypothetical protein